MSLREVQSVITAARTDALSADTDSRLSAERRKAMNYYLGNVSEDIPDETGRSTAVSTDVSDTIDGLMPVLMEIFAGGDEVVQFEPVGPEDVGAAQQETDYINHVFMQQNPGFVVLYTMIKDALLSKAGIVKVWWEKTEKNEESTFFDLSDDQFQLLLQDPDVEIIEHSVKDMPGDPEEEKSASGDAYA